MDHVGRNSILARRFDKSRYIKGIRFIFIFLLWNLFCSAYLFAASISGYVKVVESLEPLAYVNVFLANTDHGTSSDLNGYFSISGIKGRYQLIASHSR